MRGKLVNWYGRHAMINYLTDETERLEAQSTINSLINGVPGGVGIYMLNRNGVVDCIYLNDGYYNLIGVKREERSAYVRTNTLNAIHPEDIAMVARQLMSFWKSDNDIRVECRVRTTGSEYKWLSINASVAARGEDYIKLYACYTDINELKKLQLSLEASQQALEIAARAQRMSFWLYHLDTHELSGEFSMVSPLNIKGAQAGNVPESIYGTGNIYLDDEPEFRAMYEQLFAGESTSECMVRILNGDTGRYEWQQLTYVRLDDKLFGRPSAIGYSINSDLQQEALLQYQNEQQFRRQIIASSVSSYQINITKGIIEEHESVLNDRPLMFSGARITPELDEQLLDGVPDEDRDTVRDMFFADGIARHFARGETELRAVYRRYFEGWGYRYVVSNASIIKMPDSNDVVGFVYTRDIDIEKKNAIAMESVLDEEIELIGVVHIASGTAHFVKAESYKGIALNEQINFDEHVRSVINTSIYEEDRELCQVMHIKNLVRALENESAVTIAYREFSGQGELKRKKARAFYLDEMRADIVVVARDITDLYEDEQQQKQVLEAAVSAANVANKAKSEFISRMSHDMRTPLNAVLALSGRELTQGLDEAKKDEHLTQIHASGEYLLGIINDVLDMARIESRKLTLNPEPCTREEFIGTLKVVIGEQCKERGVNFVINGGAVPRGLMIDKVRLKQVFVNLLSNAVKFTPPGGTVSYISRELSCENGISLTEFIVRDTGIGMSEEFLPHAFESFTQELRAGSVAGAQGTGLGLPIVKQLVEFMGGEIRVKSELGKGTEFTVTIPFVLCAHSEGTQSETPDAAQRLAALNKLSGAQVLLCEDNGLNAHIAKSLLEKKGCVVTLASNGSEGVELFKGSQAGHFGVILMDIRMPVMDGMAATRAIRSLGRADAKTVPIIAMTADAFTEDVRTSLQAGMNGHLAKPIDPQKLYETVAAML